MLVLLVIIMLVDQSPQARCCLDAHVNLSHCYTRIRTTPHQYISPPAHHTGIGPDEWIYWLVVVLVGSHPSGELS